MLGFHPNLRAASALHSSVQRLLLIDTSVIARKYGSEGSTKKRVDSDIQSQPHPIHHIFETPTHEYATIATWGEAD